MHQTITQDDLSALAGKLDDLGKTLTEKEQSLLLAVFRLAGLQIRDRMRSRAWLGGTHTESGGVLAAPPRTALAEGFRQAFVSVGHSDFNLRSELDKAAGGVGISVTF